MSVTLKFNLMSEIHLEYSLDTHHSINNSFLQPSNEPCGQQQYERVNPQTINKTHN